MKAILIIFVFIFYCFGCSTSHAIFSSYSDFNNYDKVKLHASFNNQELDLKGFLFLDKRDSVFCFKFWGPLGIEAFKGSFHKSLTVFDLYNNQEYSDIENYFSNKFHFKLSSQFYFSLFCFDETTLRNAILNSNPNFICKAEFLGSDSRFYFYDRIMNTQFDVFISKKHNIPQELKFHCVIGDQIADLNFKVVSVTNVKRNCTF